MLVLVALFLLEHASEGVVLRAGVETACVLLSVLSTLAKPVTQVWDALRLGSSCGWDAGKCR